jgi:hypothetical protein
MAQTSTRERSAYEENFRDHLGNVTPDGKRLKIHPRKPRGAYHRARVLVSWVLLVIFFGGPFVTINAHPLLLLNIIERKFVLFGVPFWPQDFHLFLLVTLTFVMFIVLFTAIFGRLWCGWACPQTIFLEMVFRKIEYFIEGDAVQQRRLDKAPWTADKMMRKGLKHGIYAGLSFLIANTFLAYIIGIDELWVIVTDPPSQHLAGLGSITLFSRASSSVRTVAGNQSWSIRTPSLSRTTSNVASREARRARQARMSRVWATVWNVDSVSRSAPPGSTFAMASRWNV